MSGATGLVGVERFAAAYPAWPATFGDALASAMKGLEVLIAKAGTGGAMFRSLHARFLHDMADLLASPQLMRTAQRYDELADTWVVVADAAAIGDHAGGLEAVSLLAGLERSGVQAMRDWLAGSDAKRS